MEKFKRKNKYYRSVTIIPLISNRSYFTSESEEKASVKLNYVKLFYVV